MEIHSLLNNIPENRRNLLFLSEAPENEIDYSQGSYKDALNPPEASIVISLKDYKNTDFSNSEEEEDINKNNDFFINEDPGFWDDISAPKYDFDVSKRPEHEWDRHTIFINLPIKEYFGEKEYLAGDLFLSSNYRNMYPENRFRYLSWLNDIRKPAERMFIDLYTECLERAGSQDFISDAVNELLLIKEHHFSKTMSRRMNGTIFNLCVINNRKDILYDLYKSKKIEEINNPILEIYLDKNEELSASDFFSILRNLKFKLQITKGYESLFVEAIEKIFNERYVSNTLPINKIYKGENTPLEYIRWYNWNLSSLLGPVSYPEIYYEENFNKEINNVYPLCYEYFKLLKKVQRKKIK
jgi:hypothetical protein